MDMDEVFAGDLDADLFADFAPNCLNRIRVVWLNLATDEADVALDFRREIDRTSPSSSTMSATTEKGFSSMVFSTPLVYGQCNESQQGRQDRDPRGEP
jgi:hypothetical protein